MPIDFELQARLRRVAAVFTPSRPVTDAAVFAGREAHQRSLVRAVYEPGRHAVIYGARGVGKTSLTNIVSSQMAPQAVKDPGLDRVTVVVRCTRDDDFDTLFQRVASAVEIVPVPGMPSVVSLRDRDRERGAFDAIKGLAEVNGFIAPPLVAECLRGAANLLVVFDEFDALVGEDVRAAFADLLKLMSDEPEESPTLVLVGVATDVESLVGLHESIQRCTEQIFMHPMSEHEVRELVHNGFDLLEGLGVGNDAVAAVTNLSRGYPAFAHSLCKVGCEIALEAGRETVTAQDIVAGAVRAVESVPYSLNEKFALATDRRHRVDDTAVTLAAAAWAGERFRPSDVLTILEEWGFVTSIQNVTNHLKRLTEPARGGVLRSIGDVHPRYQFTDPMFVPHVVIEFLGQWPPVSVLSRFTTEEPLS